MLPVVVVGAGPTGLATAAALDRRGVPAVVLEQGDGVGAAWRRRYRGLRLNSGRAFSGLPGMRMPRGAGTFPGRDDVVTYLEAYSAAAGLDVRTGVHVRRVTEDRGQWRVVTDHGDWRTGEVVVATGLLARGAVPPEWGADRSSIRTLHSTDYTDPVPFAGADVLVVGAGSSGFEIAHDLAHGGARGVWLAVRTPPNILPRSVAGNGNATALRAQIGVPVTGVGGADGVRQDLTARLGAGATEQGLRRGAGLPLAELVPDDGGPSAGG
ncbi:putative Flavin-containing monooxygenase [Blastococcus saxobsidens DD2]|uniref:Putative Flavin-containing monooxygenase n=2 Tax=Blastococcus saxobsidens TaxID=138336 RepID=H6RRA3_BLASD|nr:putative Flavin-containing monooxygenase [Blastococcus saxobsidens DD2]